MEKVKHLFKREYFRKLLWSYAIVLIILSVAYLAMCTVLTRVILEEHQATMHKVLENVRDNIDSEILMASQISNQIETNKSVIDTLGDNKKMDLGYSDYENVKYLKQIKAISDKIDDIYIYDRGRNRVLSARTATDATEFFESTHQTEIYTETEWRGMLNGVHNSISKLVMLPKSDSDEKYIAYVQYLPYAIEKQKTGTLVILMNPLKFVDTAIKKGEDSQFVVSDRRGDVFLSIGNDIKSEQEIREIIHNSVDDNIEFKKDKNRYLLSEIKSNITSLRYIMITNEKEQASVKNRLTNVGIVLALLYLLSIILSLLVFLKKSYTPVNELFSKISSNRNNDGRIDEIKSIFMQISDLNEKYRLVNYSNEKKEEELKRSRLKNLLENSAANKDLTEEDFRQLDLLECTVCVLMIRFEKDSSENKILESSMAHYAVSNVGEELFLDREINTSFITAGPDLMACIIRCDACKAAADAIQFTVRQMKDFFFSNFNMNFSFALSGIHDAYELHDCYTEALYAIDYRFIYGEGSFIRYEDVTGKSDEFRCDDSEYGRLINYINEHNYENAAEVLARLFEENIYSGKGSILAVHGFIHYTVIVLMRVLPVIHKINLNSLMAGTAKRLENELLSVIKQHCAIKPDSLGSKIIRYIDENYMDPDLSINIIGLKFKLAPSYISKLFREQTNQNLLNYIHMVRIKHAKEYLSQNISIEKVAQKTGYLNANSFTRTFKKYEGITPSAYRKLSE